jgi:hypothetical protein
MVTATFETQLHAENWPQFRGPTGLGYTTDAKLPAEWGGKSEKNVLWKSPLVGKGHASPIVWSDRVFVCTARWDESVKDRKKVIPEQHVLCYRVSDGKLLWDRKIPPGPWLRTDFRSGPGGGYAAPTPATDGKLLYCAFGSSVIAALNFDGKIVWKKDIVPHTFDVTLGSSPIPYRDTLILLCAMAVKKDSRIAAFNKTDGAIKWERNIAPTGFAHSTPVIIRTGQKDQMIVVASGGGDSSHGIQSFDPSDGKRLWWCKGQGDASSPAYGSGIVYADSGRGGPGAAVAVDGKNGVTKTHIKWVGPRITEAIGSPIIVGKFVYRLTRNKRVRCWSLSDGKEIYSEKLEGVSTTWASPVADAQKRIYFASAGKSYVIQSGPKFKVLGVSDLGDSNHPSPAVADGRMFLVGMKNIYCIGKKSSTGRAAETSAPSKPNTTAAKAPQGKWVCISDGALAELAGKGIKTAWPGKTAGIAADRTTGDVYMIVSGQGVWRSSDKGATFARVDNKTVGGRCETGYTLRTDPAGKRLACFMLDGKSARTDDGGKTWTSMKNVLRGYDWAAVDWSGKQVKTIFALVHECGGIGAVSRDGGKSWKEIGKKYFAVGVFGSDVLVCGKEKEKGVLRSTDGGKNWTKVCDATPIGAMTVFQGVGYWLSDKGLLTSADQGKSWRVSAETSGAAWGPYFGKSKLHLAVVNGKGFQETSDGGKTWRTIAPYPPGLKGKYNNRGWFLNFAWDPVGKVCYVSRMGQSAWKCEY